jgi:hypothetical protein
MPRTESMRSAEQVGSQATLAAASPWRGVFALHDVVLLGYLALVRLLLFTVPAPGAAAWRVDLSLVGFTAACVICRMVRVLPERVRAHLYRLTLLGIVLESYLMLRHLLPLVRPDSVDEALLAIDTRLFGVTPALWLERFNRLAVVEWFSFFYFSYFWICGSFAFVILYLMRPGRHTNEFVLGGLLVLCLGQVGYFLVPGNGPIHYLAHEFHGPIAGGFFWQRVWETVQAGSAMKDIFPSLHTAIPLFFALYAWQQSRRDRRWRIPAAVTSFFSFNIVISTMVLRWHYAIDVVAGVALAVGVAALTPRLGEWERRWRKQHGAPDPWGAARETAESRA